MRSLDLQLFFETFILYNYVFPDFLYSRISLSYLALREEE